MVSSRSFFLSVSILFVRLLQASGSGIGPAYVASTDGKVYSFELQTGNYLEIVAIPGALLSDIAVASPNLAYAIDNSTGALYAIDTQKKEYNLVATLGTNYNSIQILNNKTAILTNYTSNGIYKVDLASGAQELVATVPSSPGLIGLAIASDSLVYTIGYIDNNVYAVDINTGTSTLITPTPLSGNPDPWGAAFPNSSLYIAGDAVRNVFKVDISDGSYALVSPTDMGSSGILGVAISGNTAYVTSSSGDIFALNLLDGSYITFNIPGSSLFGIGLLLRIPTNTLSGNNLKLANYLNAYGSFSSINSLAFLGEGLNDALASASPIRNCLSTLAAQNAQIASTQILIDHMHLKRLEKQIETNDSIALAERAEEEYIAGPVQPNKEKKGIGYYLFGKFRCKEKKETSHYTFWGTPFGEYAKGKGKGQLPDFNVGLGGVVFGFDVNLEEKNSFGIGGSYVFTHLQESKDVGKANINQGYLTAYGEIIASDWYFDLGLWGGYYASRNIRHINFPAVHETAYATIQGWQLTPHFEVGYNGLLSKAEADQWFNIEPFLIADWVADWEKGYEEEGAKIYNMGQNGRFCSLFRGEGGLRLIQVIQREWGRLFFTEKGSYAYQKAFNTGKITAFLVGSAGNFTVETWQQGQNLGVFELSLLFFPKGKNIPYFDLRYQGEFGSRYQSHQGMLEIGKTF